MKARRPAEAPQGPPYILVEKILAPGEPLVAEWREVARFAAAIDRVTADHDYTIITREGGKPAAVLMSLGMMMLSPVLVALPFKLMLFVLADGWNLLLGSLAASFST